MKNKITAEFKDTEREFKWRLVCKKTGEKSHWSKLYSGLLTYQFKDGRVFGLATDYWAGSLPTEVPFEIVRQKE